MPARGERLGAPDVVAVVRVAAVDDHVVAARAAAQRGDRVVDAGRRHHQPDRARRLQLLHQLLDEAQRRRPLTSACTLLGMAIEGDDLVARLEQARRHVGAHPTESDHPELRILHLLVMSVTRAGGDSGGSAAFVDGVVASAGSVGCSRARGRSASPAPCPSSTPHWSNESMPQIDALGEDAVLVQRDQRPERARRQRLGEDRRSSAGCPP